jgi:hypothetical protein
MCSIQSSISEPYVIHAWQVVIHEYVIHAWQVVIHEYHPILVQLIKSVSVSLFIMYYFKSLIFKGFFGCFLNFSFLYNRERGRISVNWQEMKIK